MYRKAADGSLHFAMIKDPFGVWTFPKGHVRNRIEERYKDAARRELREEVGLKNLRFIARLGSIDIWFKDRYVHKGQRVHKFIHYYLFEAPRGSRLKRGTAAQKKEGIKDVAWVPIEDVTRRSGYKDMRSITHKAKKIAEANQKKR